MATRKPKTQNTQTSKRDFVMIGANDVSDIIERWSDDNSALFDCVIYGAIQLYGLTVRFNANDEPWIAFPSRKGNDGNYYKHYYCVFDASAVNKIVDTLYPSEG